jgi:hypothetical protein
LYERSAEEVHELAKDAEDPVSSFVDEQIHGINDPDKERHVVPAVGGLVVRCQVPREIDKDDEDDNLEGDEGFSHWEAVFDRAAKIGFVSAFNVEKREWKINDPMACDTRVVP